jgi:GTP cyclohydrolase FolE2
LIKNQKAPRAEFSEALADVQSEESQIPVFAGVSKLRIVRTTGSFSFPVVLTIQTSSGYHRGVHMSRLVKAAGGGKRESMEGWLKRVCREVDRSQPGSEVICSYDMPHRDQFTHVTIRARTDGPLTYRFDVTGMTACPCSKKMIGIGHMQRAELSVVLDSRAEVKTPEVVAKIEGCFSAFPIEMMKRPEEALKILEAQDNPKFAEDLVRECVGKFPKALYVQARCFESIHAHDAVATWSRKPGWQPAL